MIEIREERETDREAIHKLNEQAFGQPTEANIVDALRASCPGMVSLVALINGRVAGHILFSPVVIESRNGTITGMGLAPLAVLPEHRRQGIGSELIRAGISRLRDRRCPFVVVVGRAGYYLRFGFERASLHDIRSQWDGIPDEAFMVLMLDNAAMTGVTGVARYRSEFDSAV